MTNEKTVLIVGAGISGLSAAIALARSGHDVTVVERSSSVAEGAAISITNRGNDALLDLGVLGACMHEGIVGMSGTLFKNMYDASGNPLPDAPIPGRVADGIPAFLTIYRPTLARIMEQMAVKHGATVRRKTSVHSLTQDASSVEVIFDDGAVTRYDIVVGADGTQSTIRRALFGRVSEPVYSGLMSLRWVKANPPRDIYDFYIDTDATAVVAMRLRENLVYIATGLNMENRHLTHAESVAAFRSVLSRFPAPRVRELLEMVDDHDAVLARPYCFHLVPKPWHQGRIVLIGDAAHSMSAHLSSGGSLAVEDGVVLGQELHRAPDLETGLANFENRRFDRVANAIHACRDMLLMNVEGAFHSQIHKIRAKAVEDLLLPF